jgi:hypothetical protein
MELEEICGTNESMEEHGKDTTGSQGARVWDQQQEEAKGELRELFGTEFPNFQKGDGMDKLEVDDEIPTCLAINVTVKGGGACKAMVDTGAFSIWVCEAVLEKVGTVPKIPGGGTSAADGRALPVLERDGCSCEYVVDVQRCR